MNDDASLLVNYILVLLLIDKVRGGCTIFNQYKKKEETKFMEDCLMIQIKGTIHIVIEVFVLFLFM